MSEQEIIRIYGPKPRPDNTRITGHHFSPEGEVRLSVASPKNLQQRFWMSERGIRSYIERYQGYMNNSTNRDPEFLADIMQEINIMRFGLASVQAVKIENGHELDTPIERHPMVEVKFPSLYGVPVPDGL